MPAQLRRTWAQLLEEFIRRLGRRDDPAIELRAKEWITAAYYDIVTIYHHYELETADTTVVLSTGQNFVTLSMALHLINAFRLRPPTGGDFLANLSNDDFRSLISEYDGAVGQPTAYARHGDRVYFDKKPDQAYQSTIFFIKIPIGPTFDGAVLPEIARQWDEVILLWALALAWRSLGSVDRALDAEAAIEKLLAKFPHSLLSTAPNYQRFQSDTQLPASRAGGQG